MKQRVAVVLIMAFGLVGCAGIPIPFKPKTAQQLYFDVNLVRATAEVVVYRNTLEALEGHAKGDTEQLRLAQAAVTLGEIAQALRPLSNGGDPSLHYDQIMALQAVLDTALQPGSQDIEFRAILAAIPFWISAASQNLEYVDRTLLRVFCIESEFQMNKAQSKMYGFPLTAKRPFGLAPTETVGGEE